VRKVDIAHDRQNVPEALEQLVKEIKSARRDGERIQWRAQFSYAHVSLARSGLDRKYAFMDLAMMKDHAGQAAR
jgi:hypothetical protein